VPTIGREFRSPAPGAAPIETDLRGNCNSAYISPVAAPSPTLGTLLRHVLELLDGAVEEAYRRSGLAYRPRYTPVVRALLALGPSAIRALAGHAGMTHSAVSQTVSQMKRDGLVELRPGEDARERIVALTPAAQAMVPELERRWAATNAAARALDAELSVPLSRVLAETIERLQERSFAERIERAVQLQKKRGSNVE
jgi:DNA-binding MarR family transcriptional regulator